MIEHRLNADHIDSEDEISGDEQLVGVWCNTHKQYEWHWLDRDDVRYGGLLIVHTKQTELA